MFQNIQLLFFTNEYTGKKCSFIQNKRNPIVSVIFSSNIFTFFIAEKVFDGLVPIGKQIEFFGIGQVEGCGDVRRDGH